MGMLNNLVLKIKRRESPFYDKIYKVLRALLRLQIPSFKPVHLPLYHLQYGIRMLGKRMLHGLWSAPLFKARCHSAGVNLSLPNGIPLVTGGHLKMMIGNNVTIGRATIGASKVYDEPILSIGDNTSLHYGIIISVAKEVRIGRNCLFAVNCLIMDSDDHPMDPVKRAAGQPVEKGMVRPVIIGDNVWVGAFSAILKGVSIGDNAVVATHSVVTRDVPPNSVVAGAPARVVKENLGIADE
jgi:acetyltransferase-like isoleucine patch superfamily enzyme